MVRQDAIDQRPAAVQTLVDGIARSGLWLDAGRPHRAHAADFVGRFYFNQPPALLRFVLINDLERVSTPACRRASPTSTWSAT